MGRIKYNKKIPDNQLERLKPSIRSKVTRPDIRTPLDLSQYLPLNVVREKIEEAVKATKAAERKQYEKMVEEIHIRDIKIARLESMEGPDSRYEQLIINLQYKLDGLYNKIADGSIQPLVGSRIGGPELEDKIFIDPIDKDKEPILDSHIDIKEEELKAGRDMETDLAKLRKLLK